MKLSVHRNNNWNIEANKKEYSVSNKEQQYGLYRPKEDL